jgi:hypothetical protein
MALGYLNAEKCVTQDLLFTEHKLKQNSSLAQDWHMHPLPDQGVC